MRVGALPLLATGIGALALGALLAHSLWRPVTPDEPGEDGEDWDGRFFATVLLALPGYRRLYSGTGVPEST